MLITFCIKSERLSSSAWLSYHFLFPYQTVHEICNKKANKYFLSSDFLEKFLFLVLIYRISKAAEPPDIHCSATQLFMHSHLYHEMFTSLSNDMSFFFLLFSTVLHHCLWARRKGSDVSGKRAVIKYIVT